MTTSEDSHQKKHKEWLEIFVNATGTTEITEQQDQEPDKRIADTIEAETTSSQ